MESELVHVDKSGMLLWGPGPLHHYFHSEGFTDLSVMRTDAEWRRTKAKPSEESVIHLHPKDPAEVPISCHLKHDDKHEYYQIHE